MLEMVKPQYLIINNLATDSLHRNGNPDYVSQRIIEGCNKYRDTVLIVNGDDPICCGIGENAQNALKAAGIQLVSGLTGSVEDAVRSYLDQK